MARTRGDLNKYKPFTRAIFNRRCRFNKSVRNLSRLRQIPYEGPVQDLGPSKGANGDHPGPISSSPGLSRAQRRASKPDYDSEVSHSTAAGRTPG